MQHKRLRGFLRDVDRIDALLIVRRAQRHRGERLGLPAGEQRGAVRARQPAHLAGDRPDGIEIAAIDALPCREHAVSHRVVLDPFDHLCDLAQLVGELLGQLLDDRRLDGAERLSALGLHGEGQRFGHLVFRQCLDPRDEIGWELGLHPFHLGLAHRLDDFVGDVEQFLDALVGDFERLDDLRFGELERAALDHDDRIAGSGDGEIDVRKLQLLERGIEDPRAFDAAHPHRRDRAVPWHLRQRQRGRGRGYAEHVGVVLLVGREDVDEDLHFVLEALGEERPDGAVDDARRRDLFVGGPALALQKAAGDLAGGVGLLAILDGQREVRKVGHIFGDGDRRQHYRFTELEETRPSRLLGQPTRFDFQGAAGKILFHSLHCVACLER